MFGLGSGELLIILAIVVLVFGAKKLPQLGDGLGKALKGFKKAVNDDPPPAKPEVEEARLAKDEARPAAASAEDR
jgi:TatA/E family protein of Tat protein translocase